MALTQVNEGSTAYLTVTFLDKDGAQQAPVSVTWQAQDVRSGTELQAETSITPAASVEITLLPAVNRMVNTAWATEKHRITVKATYGDGSAVNGQYDYEVVNLSQVS